jgi:DNA processing protein
VTTTDTERHARLALSFLASPGDPVLGAALRTRAAAEIISLISRVPSPGSQAPAADLAPRAEGWRARLDCLPSPGRLRAWQASGLRVVMPGDPEWPPQLGELGDAAPLVLWLHGPADLRQASGRAVAITGGHAPSPDGIRLAREMAAELTGRGITVMSGDSRNGVDAAAQRGVMTAGGKPVAVLAGGLARGSAPGPADPHAEIARHGILVSEYPPPARPGRLTSLRRDQLLAALATHGTVIVEVPAHGSALATARHARDLGRPLMTWPGPVTARSAGCHQLIQQEGALCVTGADNVISIISAAPIRREASQAPGGLAAEPDPDGKPPALAGSAEAPEALHDWRRAREGGSNDTEHDSGQVPAGIAPRAVDTPLPPAVKAVSVPPAGSAGPHMRQDDPAAGLEL